jgi:hypothetical protein
MLRALPLTPLLAVAACSSGKSDRAELTIDRQPTYDFGAVVSGTSSPSIVLSVKNAGRTATTPLAAAVLSGDDKDQFAVSHDGCVGQKLASGATCGVAVQMMPTRTKKLTATLTVAAQSGGSSAVQLSGLAVKPSKLVFTPSPVVFGTILEGNPNDSTVTLTNGADASTGPLSFALSGSDAGEFSVVGGTCVAGQSLDAMASCTLVVRFAPTSGGDKTASLVVSGTEAGTSVTALVGSSDARPVLAFSAASYSPTPNDPVRGGTNALITLTLQNQGAQPSGNLPPLQTNQNTDFQVVASGTCMSGAPLAAGASCTIVVAFNPSTYGARSDTLSVTASPGGTAAASLQGFGQQLFTLTVNKAGTGAGHVKINGTDCQTFPCAVSYVVSDQKDVVDALVSETVSDANSSFGGWTGCTGDQSCKVTMDQSHDVQARFNKKQFSVTVNVNSIRNATGVITTDPATQLNCTNNVCTAKFDMDTNVQLTAIGTSGNLFQSWAASSCPDRFSTSCATGALAADFSTSVTFRPAINYMFVTSGTIVPSNIGSDLKNADQLCDRLARNAGLVNTPNSGTPYFRALLSTSGQPAHSRLDGAQGWIRPDGKEFANKPVDLFNESGATKPYQMFYSPEITENGTLLQLKPLEFVVTGANDDGTTPTNETCGDWTINGVQVLREGNQHGAPRQWIHETAARSCGGNAHVYCFETTLPKTEVLPQTTGRVAFLTDVKVMGSSGGNQLGSFIDLCTNEGNQLNIPGATFLPLIATSDRSPSSRFSLDGAPWVRPDGVLLADSPSAFMTGHWQARLAQTAAGNYLGREALSVWKGSFFLTASAPANESCNDWAPTGTLGGCDTLANNDWDHTLAGVNCSQSFALICLQQ